jgi:hypothetical protein
VKERVLYGTPSPRKGTIDQYGVLCVSEGAINKGASGGAMLNKGYR